ncbi:lipoyl(octanoyl) transferase LipB [uncultured Bacteroides sp.]|uniref:lipoyl(octanoyl) transferase LipB n=1 Tax=uncultured Bacteroides sp. TaxID=162156 RepID=UPI00261574BD|nr:lipoyl(octanoyl) transferase LipB [uncultured Bacteroides sp.]
MKIENWKHIPYSEAWERQTELFDSIIKARREGQAYENRIIFCTHPHVYTIGKHGKQENMLISDDMLSRIGAEVFRIDRGGDITYHGPGQQVCYPILCLEDFKLGLKGYLHQLEEVVIRTCSHYGIKSGRVDGATGVWIDIGTSRERKICAMGVRSSHFVTMHGLALNVNTDLRYFDYINPCGFTNKGVTSIEKETGVQVSMDEVRQILTEELLKLF